MRRRGILIVKYVLIWWLAVGLVVIDAAKAVGENLPLLLVDLRTGFADNPALPQQFRNKLILLSAALVLLVVFTLCTQDFRLKFKIGKWSAELTSGSRALACGWTIGLLALALCFLWTGFTYAQPQLQKAARGNWQGELLVAHACGGIENTDYTNSVEAFTFNYQGGIKTMEIDFRLTSDGRLVCCHEWDAQISSDYEAGYVYSEKEFMNTQIFDRFTPMSLETLFGLMREYEDVWIVTDTKDADWATIKEEFQVLVDTAAETDSTDLLDRFIIQLYNYDMYDAVEGIYSFPNYILTLYMLGIPDMNRFTEYCRFCKARNISSITMWYHEVTPEVLAIADAYGIDIYAHTVNDLSEFTRLREMGVEGFYTDYILPDMVK